MAVNLPSPPRRARRPQRPPRPPERRRRPAALLGVLALLGPGLIAANAGNDAGGVATYSSAGARYGYGLLWVMVLITVSLVVVQRLAARMGVVTGKGLAELVRERHGARWSLLLATTVLVANAGICVSDFVGIGAALGLAGVPVWASVPPAAAAVWLVLMRGTYRGAERLFVWMALPFLAYPVAALLAHPDWGAVGHHLVAPHVRAAPGYLMLLVALAGTTITPYMQLYLQSSVVERGSGRDRLRAEQAEAAGGAVFANLVACFIIVATGATLFVAGRHAIGSAAQAAEALRPLAGSYAELLFGVGLLGASLLAAAILPVTTAYVVAESFGFEKGLSHRPRQAPVFAGVITALIAVAAVVALIPGVPVIGLLVGVQVVNGVLLPITLTFVWRLARDPRIMGADRVGPGLGLLAGVTVVTTSALSLALLGVTLLGGL